MPAPSSTPAPTPSPTAEPATSYFRPLTGYEWVIPPPEVNEGIGKAFEAPAIAQYFSGQPVARLVTRRGDPTGMLLLALPLQPAYAALPTVLDAIVRGFDGEPPSDVTLAGRRTVFIGAGPKHEFKSLVWQQRSLVLWLYGFGPTAPADMTTFAEQVITVNAQ